MMIEVHKGTSSKILDLRIENISLYMLISDIRAAAGDAEGRMMQHELIAHIKALVADNAELRRQVFTMRGA